APRPPQRVPGRAPRSVAASPARGERPRLPNVGILIATEPFPPHVVVADPTGGAVAPRAPRRVPARAPLTVAASLARGVWTRLPAADMPIATAQFPPSAAVGVRTGSAVARRAPRRVPARAPPSVRSEERRVGKEGS